PDECREGRPVCNPTAESEEPYYSFDPEPELVCCEEPAGQTEREHRLPPPNDSHPAEGLSRICEQTASQIAAGSHGCKRKKRCNARPSISQQKRNNDRRGAAQERECDPSEPCHQAERLLYHRIHPLAVVLQPAVERVEHLHHARRHVGQRKACKKTGARVKPECCSAEAPRDVPGWRRAAQ